MLIYLYGSDTYRRSKKLSEIIGTFRIKHPEGDVRRFSFEDKEAVQIFSSFITAQSLFGGPRIGILTDLEDAPKEVAELLKAEKDTKGTTLIAISEKKLGSPFTFLSKEPVLMQHFETLDSDELEAFGVLEAEAREMKVSASALKALAATFKGDTWGFVTELEQVSLGGEQKKMVHAPPFFTLIQNLKSGDMGTRLSAVTRLIEHEEPAAAWNIAASLAEPGLKGKMADYDILIKSGKLEYGEALLDFVLL
ncbi:MAG: hypothetical protein AAB518_04095 [Patescibacteria group bacterium]